MWDVLCAAASGDTAALRRVLERDPNLYRAEYWYTQPIHFAVREGHLEAVRVLLDAGADPGWVGLFSDDLLTTARDRGHEDVARRLEDTRARRGPTPPVTSDLPDQAETAGELTRAAELGDLERVTELLERGVDPNAPEGAEAPRGKALHVAARSGNRALVERLLAHGADPNGYVDGSGSATWAASTPELRALLLAHGGKLDTYDLVWLDADEEAVRRVAADPGSAHDGCGGVLAAACKMGKRDLLARLLEAGARVPPVLTECRSYLLSDPAMLRMLLSSGMSPDLPNWLLATPLHDLCGRDHRGRPRPHRAECAGVLLDAGADLAAKDEDYRSTPLAWAARCDLPDMVELLLERGAPTHLPDDAPWATPLAWATRRGHGRIAEILRAAGARA